MKNETCMIRTLGFQEQLTFSIPLQGVKIPNGKNEFIVSGDVGNSSREAINIAITLLRLSDVDFRQYDYHIHFLYTKYPKTGPSCGLATYIMLSWLTGVLPYQEGFTATATMDLQGYIYPISHINEKINCWLESPSSYLIIAEEQKCDDFKSKVKQKKKKIFKISHINDLIAIFQ